MAETLNQLKTYLQSEYEFQKNLVTGRLEFRFAGTNHRFERLDTYKLNSILCDLTLSGLNVSKSELNMLLNSDFTPRVDVFKTYFEQLPTLTDATNYIGLLADTVTTNNQELWHNCFSRWLVAAVACAINPNENNHQVLVLVGPQGIGKTTWLNRLLPPSLAGYMYAGYVNPNNKDTLTTLSENLFVNLDELGSFRNNDLESLKELITKGTIQVRRPYAEFADNFVRRASFMGAVNNFSFLSDTTGNRRFLPFTVTAVNYDHDIDLDKVYRQAYILYLSGFKYWFDTDEISAMREHLEQYEDKSIEQQLIEGYFEPSNDVEQSYAMTSTQVGQYFAQDGLRMSNASVQKIGSILRQKDFKRIKHQGVYKYLLKAKSKSSIESTK